MIAENVRKLRESLGLSQSAMAERLGVSKGVIVNIELDRLKDPEKKMPLLKLIAKEFGVSVDWILNGGPLELDNQTEKQAEAKAMGQLIRSDDPIVKTFIEFWCQRTPEEKELLTKQLMEGVELLRKNMK